MHSDSPRIALTCSALALFAAACAPAPVLDDPPAPTVALPDCQPNADGRITRDELPFLVGGTARVRVGTTVAVDTDGEPGQGSARVWDLSRPDPAEEARGELTLEALDDQWFASAFPDATLAGPLAPGNRLYGPLSIDDDGVWLHGSASRDEDPEEGRTFLVYNTPVQLYPFPLEVGAGASTTSLVQGGSLYGIPVAFEDTTTITVSAHGEVRLPDLVVADALRVTVRLERVPVAGISVQQVTHIFVNECVGEVARMVSQAVPLESALDDEFAVAAEVWRLAF